MVKNETRKSLSIRYRQSIKTIDRNILQVLIENLTNKNDNFTKILQIRDNVKLFVNR